MTGDIMKLSEDVSRLRELLTVRAAGAAIETVGGVMTLVVMAYYSALLLAVSLVFVPLYVGLAVFTTSRTRRLAQEAFEHGSSA